MKKKVLALLLSAALAFSFVPGTVSATEANEVEPAVTASEEKEVVISESTYVLPTEISNAKYLPAEGVNVVVDYSAKSGQLGKFSNVTFEGITFNFGTANYTGFQHSDNLTFNNCTFNGKFFSYGAMNFNGCTFNAPESDYSMWCYAGDLTYTNCTFNGAGKFLNIYNEGNTDTPWKITCDGCTFNSSKSNKAALNVKGTCGAKELMYDVTLNNCTASGEFPAASATDKLIVYSALVQVDDRSASVNPTVSVTVDGTKVNLSKNAVAKVNGVEYTSLSAAFDAAAASNQAVELLGDTTISNLAGTGKDLLVADESIVTVSGDVSGINYIMNARVRDNDADHKGYKVNVTDGKFAPYAVYLNSGSELNISDKAEATAAYWNVYGGTMNVAGTTSIYSTNRVGTTMNVSGTLNVSGTANSSILSVFSGYADKNSGVVNITGTANVANSMTIGSKSDYKKYDGDGSIKNAQVKVSGKDAQLNLSTIAGEAVTSTIKNNGSLVVEDGAKLFVGNSSYNFVIEEGSTFRLDNASADFKLSRAEYWSSKLTNNGTIELVPGGRYAFAVADLENNGTIKIDLSNAGVGTKVIDYIGNGTPSYSSYEVVNNPKNLSLEVVDNDLVVVGDVAAIGDTKYQSLEEALKAALANKGDVTVEILSDVALSGQWPDDLKVDGYKVGTGRVTINGNSHTITGLTAPLFASTWAGKSGLVINDLTIKDSDIVKDENDAVGTVGVGAFIGYPQASEVITLKNCHLVDSSVKGGHWTGGLVGISGGYSGNDGPVSMTITIDGCSVKNSVIEGKGSVGGVIGHAINDSNTAEVIENTTVTGNTITSTGSSKIKAGVVMGTVGLSITKVSVTESNNKVTSGGETVKRIYGRFGSAESTLLITGGNYSLDSCDFVTPEVANCTIVISGGIFAKELDTAIVTILEGVTVKTVNGITYVGESVKDIPVTPSNPGTSTGGSGSGSADAGETIIVEAPATVTTAGTTPARTTTIAAAQTPLAGVDAEEQAEETAEEAVEEQAEVVAEEAETTIEDEAVALAGEEAEDGVGFVVPAVIILAVLALAAVALLVTRKSSFKNK